MKHIEPISASDFFSLLQNKPRVDSEPLRALESRLAKIEFDALSGGEPRLALSAPTDFPVPSRCCNVDGSLRDMMPQPIEFWIPAEPIFAKLD